MDLGKRWCSNFANTVREPMKEHESVLIFSKGKWTYNKQMQERIGSRKGKVTTTDIRTFMKKLISILVQFSIGVLFGIGMMIILIRLMNG